MTPTTVSVSCRECGNPPVVYAGVFFDAECGKAWTAPEFEEQVAEWAREEAEAHGFHLMESGWRS